MIPPPSGTNHLITYLRTMIPSAAIDRIITDYRIASTPDQAIIFLQLDTAGQCRTGKIMHYNPSTGKRIKDETTPAESPGSTQPSNAAHCKPSANQTSS